MADLKHLKLSNVSLGQLKRLRQCMKIDQSYDAVFIDEPSASLDLKSSSLLMEFLRCRISPTIVMTTHDSRMSKIIPNIRFYNIPDCFVVADI